MNKENNVDNITIKLDELNVSSQNRRVTRSYSILQPSNNLPEKVKDIKPSHMTKRRTINLKEEKINEKPEADIEYIDDIVGRDKEKSEILEFLVSRFTNGCNGNLYISGSPGTGKTAVVTSLLDNLQRSKKCIYHLVTCMDFSQANGVFPNIWAKLTNTEEINATRAITEIEKYLRLRNKNERPLVIVLDEVDQLTSSNQRILYRIFKWVELTTSRLIIIGIANTLDLTESQLTELILESYRPHHINFPPYNGNELEAIIKSRVKVELTPPELQAVTLCSRKVAGKSGDARVALDLYKRAAAISEDDKLCTMRSELIEANPFNTPAQKVPTTPQLVSMRRAQLIPPSSPSIKHVSRAIKEVEKASDPYRNIVNEHSGQSTLPLHQKLVLCAALVLSRDKKKSMNLGALYDRYGKVCVSQDIPALDMSDLVNICDILDTRALIKVHTHKEIRQKVFALNLDENGIASALADNSLLSSIMAKFCP